MLPEWEGNPANSKDEIVDVTARACAWLTWPSPDSTLNRANAAASNAAVGST